MSIFIHKSWRFGKVIHATIFFLFWFQISQAQLLSQKKTYSHQDSLRGSLNEFRTWFDVTAYELDVKVDIKEKSIKGECTMEYKILKPSDRMQIDLFERYEIISINRFGLPLEYKRDGNAIFVQLPQRDGIGEVNYITISYEGKLPEAKKAPWDGGFVFTKDSNGKDWVGVACEGFGASSWWPCKDHLSDEPESMVIKVSAPKGLMAIANGRLMKIDTGKLLNKFIWKVVSPINSYNVNISIGDYVHFSDTFISRIDAARLDLDYWVLRDHLDKAKVQFKQVKPMLECYEEKLGKYPFYDDSYKLVETPYLGMEHQSCIAYGNGYKKGYAGNTRMTNGHEFDYIIIHESGHEWFGNNISCADIADMWIHEAFTTYTESIFVECKYGKEKAVDYINSKFERIGNKAPMVGIYGVNEEGAGDMYAKGSLFLNTIRHLIDQDSLWWSILYDMNTVAFHHKTIGYSDVLAYFNQRTGMDFTKLFEQYLRYPSPPKLKYSLKKVKGKTFEVSMQWETDVKGFEMPIAVLTKKGVYDKVKVSETSPTKVIFKGKKKQFQWNRRAAYYLLAENKQKL